MQVAQFNVARLRAALDDPLITDFRENLATINDLGKSSKGFVWLLEDGSGSATTFRPYPNDSLVIINLSVWESLDALRGFAYRSAHIDFLRRRGEWFERMDDAFMAVWPHPVGVPPTVGEAVARLDHLRRYGPTAFACGWRDPVSSLTFRRCGPEAPELFVATLDGQAVGGGAVRRIDDTTAEVEHLYTVPSARSNGLTAAVLSYLTGVALDLGVDRLVLHTDPRQPEALALYRRAGFTDVPGRAEQVEKPLR